MSNLSNYQESSRKISEITRYIVYGILGIAFAILTLRIDYFKDKISELRYFLLIAIILCVFSLLSDYLNILMQYMNSRYKYKSDISEEELGIKWIYCLGIICFYVKQLFMILASVLLIFSLGKYL